MNHLPFIAGSYAAAAIVMAALVAWIGLDHRSLTRRLRELEARGIRRRPGPRQ
jgi:heme exporter protein D